MNHPHGGENWQKLLRRLADDESIVASTVTRLRSSVPGYDVVPTAALETSARRNIALSIRAIRDNRAPSDEDIPEAETLALERIGQGVPLGSVLSGFRASMTAILHRLLELAPESGIPADEVLRTSTLLWSIGDEFSARATAVYQEREIARAVADSARRDEWIGAALGGTIDAVDLARGTPLYGIPSDEPVRAFAVPARPESGQTTLDRLAAWADEVGIRLIAAVKSNLIIGVAIGDVFGVDSGHGPRGMTVGFGHPVSMEEISESFAAASLAVGAADAVGVRGVVDVESLSWRMGVHASPETTAMLKRRYIDPLGATGTFNEGLLEAVRAYLDNRLSIAAAARAIPVHVNTLRYRLRRYAEITGADLGDVDVLVGVKWAIAARDGDISAERL